MPKAEEPNANKAATAADSAASEMSPLEDLPDEILEEISSHLHEDDLVALGNTSHQFHTLFREPKIGSKLLLFTAQGNEDNVKVLFTISPAHIRYLIQRGKVEDYSGRKFTNISPFQYALWAMDWNMWQTMLDALQQAVNNGYPYDKAEKIRETLLTQYREVQENGLSYVLHDETHPPEHHFDFQPLINTLNTYIGEFDGRKSPQRKDHSCHVVGMLQRLVPAHVAQHFCEEKPFDGSKPFHSREFVRSVRFYNWILGRIESWFPLSADNKLGFDFALYNYGWAGVGRPCVGGPTGGNARRLGRARLNLEALSALSEIRTQDIVALGEVLTTRLKKPDSDAVIECLDNPKQTSLII